MNKLVDKDNYFITTVKEKPNQLRLYSKTRFLEIHAHIEKTQGKADPIGVEGVISACSNSGVGTFDPYIYEFFISPIFEDEKKRIAQEISDWYSKAFLETSP